MNRLVIFKIVKKMKKSGMEGDGRLPFVPLFFIFGCLGSDRIKI